MSRNDGPSQKSADPDEIENPNDPFHQYDNIMEENIDFVGNQLYINQQENPQSNYILRTKDLQQKEQILKYSVAEHQEAIKQLFMKLYNQKKKLLNLATLAYNKKQMRVDIGIEEELQEMRKKILNQQAKILKLKTDIQMQGLSGLNNERNVIMLRQKREQIENEIESGRRFAATQYVRDYLEKTYIHKVSYEDVKYEYEMKTKLKEYLKAEKESYEKKKQELKKAIEKQGAIKKELEEQKLRLEVQIGPKPR